MVSSLRRGRQFFASAARKHERNDILYLILHLNTSNFGLVTSANADW